MFTHLVIIFCVILFSHPTSGTRYTISDSITGIGFLNAFFVQSIPDPTHGRVNYVNAATAVKENLTFASGDHFVLRADYQKKLTPNGPGRDSVRLMSYKQYSTSVMIFNIRHMPQGCGTWPAVWTVGANWPNQGEIDILEGVNDQGQNHATLHTSAGCTMSASRSETGIALQNDCNVAVNYNAGCGVQSRDPQSYGPTFNNNGGGWYAVERTNAGIQVWFWSRNSAVPSDVKAGGVFINTINWGTPMAYFPSTSCPISSKFGPHNIIINLTFCGDWAGSPSVYAASGCPSTCVDYVNNNPAAFQNAYFDFAWLRVYK